MNSNTTTGIVKCNASISLDIHWSCVAMFEGVNTKARVQKNEVEIDFIFGRVILKQLST